MPDSLTPELLQLRSDVEAFTENDLRPLEEDLDPVAPVPREVSRKVVEASRERGLFGMTQPRDFGGSEAGPLSLTVAREQQRLSRHQTKTPMGLRCVRKHLAACDPPDAQRHACP